MARLVTAHANATIKHVRSLRDKKARRASGRFVAEGLRVLTEAAAEGRLPLILLFTAEAARHPLGAELVGRVETAGGDAVETSDEILEKTTGKSNAGQMLGVFDLPDTGLNGLDRGAADLWLVAERLRDPGNIGTSLRTGDAVGAGGLILLDDGADPFSMEAVRASMGAVFTKRVVQAEWTEFHAWLRSGPGELVGLTLAPDSEDYRAPRYGKPCFLLVGNEQAGLPGAYAAACDRRVRIPMSGRADSLNAAVSLAVAAYEVVGQWRG